MNSSVRPVQWLTLRPSGFSAVAGAAVEAGFRLQEHSTNAAAHVTRILFMASPLHRPPDLIRFALLLRATPGPRSAADIGDSPDTNRAIPKCRLRLLHTPLLQCGSGRPRGDPPRAGTGRWRSFGAGPSRPLRLLPRESGVRSYRAAQWKTPARRSSGRPPSALC